MCSLSDPSLHIYILVLESCISMMKRKIYELNLNLYLALRVVVVQLPDIVDNVLYLL